MALVTLVARRLEELGVDARWRSRSDRIECGVALGIPPDGDAAVLSRWVREAIDQGYRLIKLKVRPGWDS